MCMEDIRVMRRTLAKAWTADVQGSYAMLVPYNDKRVSLILPSSGGAAVVYCYGNPDSATLGILVNANSNPLMLDIQRHGALVFGPWYAYESGAGANVMIHETILLEE